MRPWDKIWEVLGATNLFEERKISEGIRQQQKFIASYETNRNIPVLARLLYLVRCPFRTQEPTTRKKERKKERKKKKRLKMRRLNM